MQGLKHVSWKSLRENTRMFAFLFGFNCNQGWRVVVEPVPAAFSRRQGYTLEKSPLHLRDTWKDQQPFVHLVLRAAIMSPTQKQEGWNRKKSITTMGWREQQMGVKWHSRPLRTISQCSVRAHTFNVCLWIHAKRTSTGWDRSLPAFRLQSNSSSSSTHAVLRTHSIQRRSRLDSTPLPPSLRRLDHLHYINCRMMRKMKANFCLISLQTNSPSISSFGRLMWWIHLSALQHLQASIPITSHLLVMNPWVRGKPAHHKGKLTILSGRFIATSAHAGTGFACIGGSRAQVLMCRSEAKFYTCVVWGMQMPVVKERLLIAWRSSTSSIHTASQTNCYHCDLTRFAQT